MSVSFPSCLESSQLWVFPLNIYSATCDLWNLYGPVTLWSKSSHIFVSIKASPILEKQLDLISNRSILWSDYGLVSLAKTRWAHKNNHNQFRIFEFLYDKKEHCFGAVRCIWNVTLSMMHHTGEVLYGWTWTTWFFHLCTITLQVLSYTPT